MEMFRDYRIMYNYPNYAISNYGEVFNIKLNKEKKAQYRDGFLIVELFNKGKSNTLLIHRLVAEYFIPNPNNYFFVIHNDENKTNNHASNLSWITNNKNLLDEEKNTFQQSFKEGGNLYYDYRVIQDYDNYIISNHGEVFNTTTNKPIQIHKNNKGYMYVSISKDGKGKIFLIHRLIAIHFIDNTGGKDCVDHIDGNVLNNHPSNLRWASHRENIHNSKLPSTNTSGHKGVSFRKDRNKWTAKIEYNKKVYRLGCFLTKEDAIKARRERANELFGQYTNSCEKDDDE
jgi:hypothetical protein